MDFSKLLESVSATGNFGLGLLGSVLGIALLTILLRARSKPNSAPEDNESLSTELQSEFEIGETDLNSGRLYDEFEISDSDLGSEFSDAHESALHEAAVVECSTFSPSIVQPTKPFTVQVGLHLPEDDDQVDNLAKAADADSELKFGMQLSSKIAIGEDIDISVEVLGATRSASGLRSVKWTGQPKIEVFTFIPNEDAPERLKASVRLFLNGMPVGAAKWAIKVSSDDTKTEIASSKLKPYRKIFVSYSSKDRTEVLKRVQMIEHSPDEYFMDLLSLNAGQRWEKALYKHIDDCDAFYIFWSKNSCASNWVLKELQHAANLQKQGDNSLPDIVPIILDVPPPTPPDFVADIHFNSMLAYVIAANAETT